MRALTGTLHADNPQMANPDQSAPCMHSSIRVGWTVCDVVVIWRNTCMLSVLQTISKLHPPNMREAYKLMCPTVRVSAEQELNILGLKATSCSRLCAYNSRRSAKSYARFTHFRWSSLCDMKKNCDCLGRPLSRSPRGVRSGLRAYIKSRRLISFLQWHIKGINSQEAN